MKSSCPVQPGDNADLARMDPVETWKSELDIQKNRGTNIEHVLRKDSLNKCVNLQKSWGISPHLVLSFSSGMGYRNICCCK